jgi:hypothetical protein
VALGVKVVVALGVKALVALGVKVVVALGVKGSSGSRVHGRRVLVYNSLSTTTHDSTTTD